MNISECENGGLNTDDVCISNISTKTIIWLLVLACLAKTIHKSLKANTPKVSISYKYTRTHRDANKCVQTC